jgi:hypothetical protein
MVLRNLFFTGILKVNDENSRIRIQDPDPLARGIDPRIRIHRKMSWIRNTGAQVHKVPNYSGFITFCSEKAKLKNKEAFCHLSLYVSDSMALASFLLAQYAEEIDTDCMDFISHDCDRISPGVLSAKAATEQALVWS